ncbi:hypothetical protein Slin_1847 [Spirosoma linguale DSM 74]|uniref:Uncharacterized protein n=1 Tax=Spirosoma linguale (strain ATCC 33905 / DSM 74 / LMG 10896 / Claus 1) TaxID=504472 RepID=D2QBL3_SPILD|nr:hypothetical protein Slin_1847 [Spirosoma linguale DSM 74]
MLINKIRLASATKLIACWPNSCGGFIQPTGNPFQRQTLHQNGKQNDRIGGEHNEVFALRINPPTR